MLSHEIFEDKSEDITHNIFRVFDDGIEDEEEGTDVLAAFREEHVTDSEVGDNSTDSRSIVCVLATLLESTSNSLELSNCCLKLIKVLDSCLGLDHRGDLRNSRARLIGDARRSSAHSECEEGEENDCSHVVNFFLIYLVFELFRNSDVPRYDFN